MGTFSGTGYGEGVLQWGENQSRRRSDIARLFEEFKRNNPYATAADYETYLDTVIGPHERYLRGNLPANDILKRMEGENMQRKQHDQQMQRADLAAKDIAVRNQINNLVQGKLLSHTNEELYDFAAELLSGGNSNFDNQTRQQAVRMVGDLDPQRDRELANYRSQKIKEAVELMDRTEGSLDPDALLGDLDIDINTKFLGPFQKQLSDEFKAMVDKRERDQRLEDERRMSGLIDSVRTDQTLPLMLAPGSQEYERAVEVLKRRMRVNGFDENDPELLEQLIGEAQGVRTLMLNQQRKQEVERYRESMTEKLGGDFKQQQDVLAAMVGSADEKTKSVVQIVSTQYLVPPDLYQYLVQYAQENNDDPAANAQDFITSLSGAERERLVTPAQFNAQAMQQANQLVPEQESAQDYSSGTSQNLNKRVDLYVDQVNNFAQQIPTMRSSADIELLIKGINRYAKLVDVEMNALYEDLMKRANDSSWILGESAFTEQDAYQIWDTAQTEKSNVFKALSDVAERAMAARDDLVAAEQAARAAQPPEPPQYQSGQMRRQRRNQ